MGTYQLFSRPSVKAGLFNGLILIVTALMISGCMQKRLPFSEQYTKEGVLYGTTATKEECNRKINTVWVEAEGAQECIAYYASGLKKKNPVVLVHIHGDVAWASYFKRRVTHVEGSYTQLSSSKLHGISQNISIKSQLPFIYLARPGTFGSSGFHGDRYHIKNPQLINAALDEIKRKYHIDQYSFSGQSGGGISVAALLNWRKDIKCAVLSSSVAAVWDRINSKYIGRNFDKYRQLIYDPSHHVDEMPNDPERVIIVLGDKEDSNVHFSAQKSYAQRVRDAGHKVEVISATATDNQRHDLMAQAIQMAAECSRKDIRTAQSESENIKEQYELLWSDRMAFSWAGKQKTEIVKIKDTRHKTYFFFTASSPEVGYCIANVNLPETDSSPITWELTCDHTKTAEGEFTFNKGQTKAIGLGADDAGNEVRLTFAKNIRTAME